LGVFDRFLLRAHAGDHPDEAGLNASRRQRCNCVGCPTFNACAAAKEERAFCISGASACVRERDMSQCICSTCSVYSELGLVGKYYCRPGSMADWEV